MQTADLRMNLLVQTPAREVLKVSTVYGEDRVSAQVVYPVPPRTTVRYYDAAAVETWRKPTNALIARYETAMGWR